MNQLVINSEKAKDVAVILFEKFNSTEGIFGHNIMPEDLLPLVVSIDYQRNADQLWEAGRKTFEDEQTRWLFFPEKLVKKNFDEIIEAMIVHKLSKKPKKDAKIWSVISIFFWR